MVASLPAAGPATLALVKAHLGITDAVDDNAITDVVNAVNAKVRSWPCAVPALADPPLADWSGLPQVITGSVMLAARVFRRRNSPDGVTAFGQDGPVYVQRNDPDVAMLLNLGAHRKPKAR